MFPSEGHIDRVRREPRVWWILVSYILWLAAAASAVAAIVGSVDPTGNSGPWVVPAVSGVIVMLLCVVLIGFGNDRWG